MIVTTDRKHKSECECNVLSSTANLFLKSIYEVYFKPLKNPLSMWLRLLHSFLGSLVFHVWYFYILIEPRGDQYKDLLSTSLTAETGPPTLVPAFGDFLNLNINLHSGITLTNLAMILVLCIIYAFVIASGYTKHGPIRYFIGSALLSTLMIFLAHSVTVDNVQMNEIENAK